MTNNSNNAQVTGKTSIKTYRDAINDAIREEMRRDPTVIVLGEEVSGGAGCDGEDDAYGGVFGVTKGLMPEFGRERVIDTPISGSGHYWCCRRCCQQWFATYCRADVLRLYRRVL